MKSKLFARKSWLDAGAILASCAIFVAIACANVGRFSTWFDESFTHFLLKFGPLDIAKWTAEDVHPPLFYWLLKAWSCVFRSDIVAFRSFAIFWGVVAIVLAFFVAKKLFGRRVALLSLPLVALSPMLARYGVEARMYTLCLAVIFAQILVFLRLRERPSRGLAVAYGVLIAAGLWTQYFVALATVAQVGFAFFALRHDGFRGEKLWRKFLFSSGKRQTFREIFSAKSGNLAQSFAVAFVLFAPWLPWLVRQFLNVSISGFWIPPVNFASFADLFSATFFYQNAAGASDFFALVLVVLVALLVGLGVAIFRQKSSIFARADAKKFRQNFAFLLTLIVVPPLLLFAISLPPMRSYFIDRYVLASLILVAILVAAVAEKSFVKFRFFALALYFLALASFVVGLQSVAYFGNFNKFSSDISTAQSLMRQISREKSAPVIADTAWSFYDADVYASAKNPVFFLNSQVDNYYFGSEKMLAGTAEEIANLPEWLAKNHVEKFWYISKAEKIETLPKELPRGWKIGAKIFAKAPNNWKGSSSAVLVEKS